MKTRRSITLIAALAVAGWAALTGESRGQATGPTVRVFLLNGDSVPLMAARRAQSEVSRLYRTIGVDLEWLSNVPQEPGRVRVISLVTWEPAGRDLPASALGARYGALAYVFVSRVERTCQNLKLSIDNVLAVAIAHELAHMLLPPGWHARRGLMQPFLNPAHLRSASAGLLQFSDETMAEIRRGLIEEVSVAAKRQPD